MDGVFAELALRGAVVGTHVSHQGPTGPVTPAAVSAALASAGLKTIRPRLIKLAARVVETATRVRVAFAASCLEAALFAGVARWRQSAGP